MKRASHSWDGNVCRFCSLKRFKTRTSDGWRAYYEWPLTKEQIERRVKPWPLTSSPSCNRPAPPPGPQGVLFRKDGKPTLEAIQAGPGEAQKYESEAREEALRIVRSVG